MDEASILGNGEGSSIEPHPLLKVQDHTSLEDLSTRGLHLYAERLVLEMHQVEVLPKVKMRSQESPTQQRLLVPRKTLYGFYGDPAMRGRRFHLARHSTEQ